MIAAAVPGRLAAALDAWSLSDPVALGYGDAFGAHAESGRRSLTDPRDRVELDDLLTSGPGQCLLHLDLHWLKALQAGGRWVVIDPKPFVGDPCAEVFAFLDGPPLVELPADPIAARTRIRRLIEISPPRPAWTRPGLGVGCVYARSPTSRNSI